MALIKHVDFEVPAFGELPSGVIARQSYREALLAMSPVGYWPMSGASPGPMADLVAGNHAAVTGAVGFQQAGLLAGDNDTCADFAGGEARTASTVINPATTAFTLTALIRGDVFSGGQHVILQQADGSGTGRGWMYVLPNGTVEAFLGGASQNAGVALSPGVTYHLAFTFAGGAWQWYVDGASAGGGSGVTPESCVGAMIIGRHKAGSFAFDGRIDEVAVFAAALDAGAVRHLSQLAHGVLEAL